MADERKPKLVDALATVQLSDLSIQSLGQMPCARSALITGMSSGGAIFVARMLGTRKIMTSGRWGVFTFALMSSLSWEFCRYQRNVAREELAKMVSSQSSA